jgi:hypothetical protein
MRFKKFSIPMMGHAPGTLLIGTVGAPSRASLVRGAAEANISAEPKPLAV